MNQFKHPLCIKTLLTVAVLIISPTIFAMPAKSFAVFYAKTNILTGQSTGGVAGTAFFISPSRALTARHVLKKESFAAKGPEEVVQLWLVRENRPAIPLSPKNISEVENQDITVIDFGTAKMAKSSETYSLANTPDVPLSKDLATDGFRASSIGPRFHWDGKKLVVDSVPQLERLHFEGRFLQKAKIDVLAADVQLKGTPCLQVDFEPIVGLSGGPLLSNGKIVGLNSFADPSRRSTWAVSLAEQGLLQ